MNIPRIRVMATGGTIAGQAGDAIRHDYRPGQLGVEELLAKVATLGIPAKLTGQQIANIGSEDMSPAIWAKLHRETMVAMADPSCDGVIITHGTDTVEETAFLLDLTLPTIKPVVLVGAMRPADAVGYDGLRNFANAAEINKAAVGLNIRLVLETGDNVLQFGHFVPGVSHMEYCCTNGTHKVEEQEAPRPPTRFQG